MKLEQQVTSLELSKRLKELGVKQDSQFYWRLSYSTSESFDKGVSLGKKGNFGEYEIQYYPKPRYTTADVKWNDRDLAKLDETEISAFTVAELGELLPPLTRSGKDSMGKEYYCRRDEDSHIEHGYTEAEARAKMIIHLLENDLLPAPSERG